MLYKALISFTGVESMTMDEVKKLTDKSIVKDLLSAGYIVPVSPMVELVEEGKAEKKGARKDGNKKRFQTGE